VIRYNVIDSRIPMDLSKFSSQDFDRGASRLKEIAWFVIRRIFFQTSTPMPSALRAALLRLFGAKIGAGAIIRAFLCTGTHNFYLPTFDLQFKPITLRSGSWVAAQSFIGPGVEVGNGSVVSAGSVVMENVPAHSLVRGNPAVVVRAIEPV